MIIQRLVLKNWKNFRDVDVRLSDRVFIVGANASGKSNLLDAIRFLRDLVKQAGGLQHAVDLRGGVSKIRCLSARNEPYISLEVHLGGALSEEPSWKYILSFKHTGGGILKNEALVLAEKVWSAEANAWVLDRSHPNYPNEATDMEAYKFTHLEQISANTGFRDVYFFFRDIQYLHVVPQLIREAESMIIAANKEDFFGRNLLEHMASTPKKTRDAYLKRINEALTIAVPQLNSLEFIDRKDDPKGLPHLEARYKHWRSKGARQTEHQFSDGTLRLIGFLWALLNGTETLLLEEPELYLHTAIIQQLAEFISRMQRKKSGIRQVIITTHSFDLLNSDTIGAEEVIVLEASNEGTTATRAADIPGIMDLIQSGFTPAEGVKTRTSPIDVHRLAQISTGES